MKKVEITAENAKQAFDKATKEGKELLTALLGEDLFKPKDIKERIKTFYDALENVGASDNVKILLEYNGIDKDTLSSQAHAKLTIIAKALNEGWTPDYSNSSQYKYYPWFKFTPGVGFSYDGYDDAHSVSGVGSRLCFKSSDLAKYAGEQFNDIYNDFLI